MITMTCLAQIEVDPELVRKAGLTFNAVCAWSGWLLCLMLGRKLAGRYHALRRVPGVRGMILAQGFLDGVLALSVPALLAAPALLFPVPEREIYRLLPAFLDEVAILFFRGYEVLFVVLASIWGTLLYRKEVLGWAGQGRTTLAPIKGQA